MFLKRWNYCAWRGVVKLAIISCFEDNYLTSEKSGVEQVLLLFIFYVITRGLESFRNSVSQDKFSSEMLICSETSCIILVLWNLKY